MEVMSPFCPNKERKPNGLMEVFMMIIYRCFLFSTLLCFMIGCQRPRGSVEGEVLFDSKPLPGGMLSFVSIDAKNKLTVEGSAELGRDGTFKIDLPVGDVMVGVDNREFEPLPATGPAKLPGDNLPEDVRKSLLQSTKGASKVSDRWVKLPEQYYLPETSQLKIKVKKGSQKIQIELKPGS
ncbi:MAG: hypothetical protein RJB11_764 [Planctomycetota bacterium]|jgi:hypothetical protein